MASSARNKTDRIFVQDGRRHYRRRFSASETRAGAIILLILAGVVAWVAWKGAHPDPTLFMLDIDLAQPGAAVVADRGPVPTGLALALWSEGEVSRFDPDNLYVKINGREGFYKSVGFEMLSFVSIVSDDDAQTVVDIELYDLGSPANALGAYSAERSPGAKPEANEFGLGHIDRNALYLTRGRYYLRAIGSDESPEVSAQLTQLQSRFELELPGEPLPWGFTLFVARMGMDPGSVAYAPENAFSFGFARDVYSATLADEAELFVTPAASDEAASDLAAQFKNGFRQYGEDDGDFVKDRYLGTFASATPAGAWVVGIRGATDRGAASVAMEALSDIVRDMPLPRDRNEPAAPESAEDSYEADEY